MATLDERGHEILDSSSVAIPVKFTRPPTMSEQIKALIRGEMSRQAEDTGLETFEEADDFDIGEDYDPTSPYETNFDQETYDGSGNESSDAATEGTATTGSAETPTGIQSNGEETPKVPDGNTQPK